MCNASIIRRIESVNVYVLPVPVDETVGEFLAHPRYTINRFTRWTPYDANTSLEPNGLIWEW